MRHRKAGVKLNMTSSHKQAMFRNMVTSLFKHDRIRTTNAKAKELRRLADHMVTLAKRGDLHARRQAMSVIREKNVVHKLFEEASERFGTASGGYTRIIKLGHRPGDAAPVSLIELITTESRDKKKPAKKAKSAAPKKVSEKAVVQEADKEKAPVDTAEAEVAAVDSNENTGDADSVGEALEETAVAAESAEPEEAAAEKKAEEVQPDEVVPDSDDTEAEDSKDKSE